MYKLYYKYGVMGSSKTAQALMCKFNYEQKGKSVLLLKPSVDTRFSSDVPMVTSRIGLKSPCQTFDMDDNLEELFKKVSKQKNYDVIIVDECQFLTEEQVNQLKELTVYVPVLCYGLKNKANTKLFVGSKRLLELADSLMEIKSVCKCGNKATMNARFVNGKLDSDETEIVIGGDECYEGMCYWCYKKLKEQSNEKVF